MKITTRSEENTVIMGIDSSTTGVAWTVLKIENGSPSPVKWGKIKLDSKKEMIDKIHLLAPEFADLLEKERPHHIFIEKSIFVKNPDTARKLSFIVGALMTVAALGEFEVTLVEPSTWKAHIGYFNLTRKFQEQAKQVLGSTEGKKICDRFRKEQTKRILSHRFPDFDISDHDISDSCGVGVWGVNQIAAECLFEKNREIAFDCVELAALKLTMI